MGQGGKYDLLSGSLEFLLKLGQFQAAALQLLHVSLCKNQTLSFNISFSTKTKYYSENIKEKKTKGTCIQGVYHMKS